MDDGFRRLVVPAEAVSWMEWPTLREGIHIRVLLEGPAPGERTALLRYEPGASVPRHLHAGTEWLLVLEGSQVDETGEHGPGTWLCNPGGTRHEVRSPGGCLVLIHWSRPVEFETTDDRSGKEAA
jgi:anti-sigma factor ChrR (cupin superfamily)